MNCLIKDSEYRMKLEQSGMPEYQFYSFCMGYAAEHDGKLPRLDEIPGTNSVPKFKEFVNMTDNSAKISDIVGAAGVENIEEAAPVLNDQFPNLAVDVFPLSESAIVTVEERPSEFKVKHTQKHDVSKDLNARAVFNELFNKLSRQYGIKFNMISGNDLKQWDDIPEVQTAKAFVHHGQIYINADLADIDAPIHEMTHILLGSIRFKNPELYFDLVRQSEKFSDFDERMSQMPNMAHDDAMEEVFVEEVGKYLAGKQSAIDKLPKNVIYELHYNIKRLLDSALMGDYSVKSISNAELYDMNLSQLAERVNSMMLQPFALSSLDDAQLHRTLANEKSDMIKKGDLVEECE